MQTLPTDTINFKDMEKGYAPFAEALHTLGFDWQIARTEDIKGWFVVHGAEARMCFRLPATGDSQRGVEVTEQSVISDLWCGVSESLAVIRQKQPGKLIKVRSMQLEGSTLHFTVS
ncbi:hypothetical protein [Zoogloea sp.]|jgi:hypothetical protein|uniref:hypothetical protein n=1 Tax=Zoogloea sp. TaxID=49181 RepID=UPI0011DB7CE5|nr:hypothetical protein [Zoogloea sp.]MBK6655944.1 hypothetical protein [Zoogloea sp.]MBK7846200.1 hypothetical protein [Zoogloea sp.]MBP7445712.1 hypothetical protein [Zoogloea sp.]TXG93166.1 MAG: hypothetical protein E6R15_10135 [Zoogloea sp.]HOY00953.1 hypothetical protein [Zoogloea sp.]